MIINLGTVRSAFYFIGKIALVKSAGKQEVDLSDCADSVLLGIASSIKNGQLSSDIDPSSIGVLIKDAAIKKVFNALFNIIEDVIEEAIEEVVEVVEDIITPDEPVSPEAQEEAEYFDSLKELLNGNIKTVVENLSNAALSDEDKIALLDFEQQDKNRKAVITAISEL
jgi:hypothetical protein